MALVSMKTDDGMAEAVAPEPYGYGLCLHLSGDQCEALGIKQPLAAGSAVMLTARAYVKEVMASAEEDGDDKGPDVRLTLQITDMEVKPQGAGSQFFDKSQMNP
jgi:hypothetical protein